MQTFTEESPQEDELDKMLAKYSTLQQRLSVCKAKAKLQVGLSDFTEAARKLATQATLEEIEAREAEEHKIRNDVMKTEIIEMVQSLVKSRDKNANEIREFTKVKKAKVGGRKILEMMNKKPTQETSKKIVYKNLVAGLISNLNVKDLLKNKIAKNKEA